MKKVIHDNDTYFVGVNGVYLEFQNTRELVDEDGIKRVVIEIKDKTKIREVKALYQVAKEAEREAKARYQAAREGKEYIPLI